MAEGRKRLFTTYDGSFWRVFTIAPITPTPSKAIAPTAIQVPLNPNKLAPYARAPISRTMPIMYTTKFVMQSTTARLLPKIGFRRTVAASMAECVS